MHIWDTTQRQTNCRHDYPRKELLFPLRAKQKGGKKSLAQRTQSILAGKALWLELACADRSPRSVN